MSLLAPQIITGAFTIGAGGLTWIGGLLNEWRRGNREDMHRWDVDVREFCARFLVGTTSYYEAIAEDDGADSEAPDSKINVARGATNPIAAFAAVKEASQEKLTSHDST